jgi:hypothetical protein
LKRIAIAASALVTTMFVTPAVALVDYAPINQVASLQGGGEAITKNLLDQAVSVLAVGSTVIDITNLSVTSRNEEFIATTGFSPALIKTELLLSTGAVNNGDLLLLGYDRNQLFPPETGSGFFAVTITSTDSVVVRNTTPFTQAVDIVFGINLVDFGGIYTNPSDGTLLIHGTSSIATSEISYSYSLIVPGETGPIITSNDEPAVLAMLAVGMLGLAYVRRR